jgi:O-antigen/teichoic acid export membrane protein
VSRPAAAKRLPEVSRRRAALATLFGSSTSTLIVAIQAVVLIPLYLQTIGPRLYGAWLGSGDVLVWLQAFDLGLPNVLIQRVGAAHGRGDRKAASEYFASAMVVMAVMAVVAGAVAVVASPWVPRLMGISGVEAAVLQRCFAVAAIGAAMNLFSNGIVGFSRAVQRTAFLNVVTIAATFCGFAVSLGLVLTGAGLWAIALGLVTRSLLVLSGGLVFVAVHARNALRRDYRPRAAMLRELVAVLPATALGGLGYSVMNQSESIIVASCLRPELATVLGVTRKVLEVGRGLIDTIAFATYGGFAHLATSGERHRVLHAHSEISAVRSSMAVVAAAAYMTVNASVVGLWVGSAQYGGPTLTILLALQFIVVGGSFLTNYLYRALGPVMRGSLALAAESVLRVPLMIGLVLWLGLAGIPLAGTLTAAVFAAIVHRWTVKEVSGFAEPYSAPLRRSLVARIMVFVVGALLCVFSRWSSWLGVGIAGVAVASVGGALLLRVDPMLGSIRGTLRSAAGRLQGAAARWAGP